jgi:glycosyltransferase involved in cell wall biosynthesis
MGDEERTLMQPRVSVVVPVYNSEDCLGELVQRLTKEFTRNGMSHEIILVNDGSRDRSWAKITELAARYDTICGINLRMNFGQDCALMAGLRATTGKTVVIMDDDLQHDPADVEKLVQMVEGGFDVSYARFPRKRQALWKNLGSWVNDKAANIVLKKPHDIYLSPYKAIAREVVEEILKYDGPYPYVDGLIFRVTNRIAQVDVEHHSRYAGRSNYNLARSIMVWLRLATSFSLAPLRLATYLGFVFASVGVVLALYYTLEKFLTPDEPLGWASLVVSILVLGGVQLACLGLIGEYLGRVFIHLNRQPQYVVKDTVGNRNTQN